MAKLSMAAISGATRKNKKEPKRKCRLYMAEWLVVKTNSRNPPHQIGNGREKQRKNSIGSYCEQHWKKKKLRKRTVGKRWEKPVTVLLFSCCCPTQRISVWAVENPSLNCKTFRRNASVRIHKTEIQDTGRFDLSTIWNRLHFYWLCLWIWNFISLAISVDLRVEGAASWNSWRANSSINCSRLPAKVFDYGFA